jgi:hypothetical protein
MWLHAHTSRVCLYSTLAFLATGSVATAGGMIEIWRMDAGPLCTMLGALPLMMLKV